MTPPKAKPNTTKLVRKVSPAAGSLVTSKKVTVKIRVAHGARLDVARLDRRPINRYLHRHGDLYTGKVTKVRAGLTDLHVTVKKGRKQGRTDTRFTVRGAPGDLLSPLASTEGLLGAAQAPGVSPVAVGVHPEATFLATVNGHRVDDAALGRRDVGGARRFVLSKGDGLHRGRNTVEATAYLPDGTWETIRSTVTVPVDTPLAEVGTAGRRQQGQTLQLDGSRSEASKKGRRLSYAWRFVQAPDGAEPITAVASSRAKLRLSAAGDYVVALTVTEQAGTTTHTSTDLLSVTSMPIRPAVGARLQTLTTNTAHLPPAKEDASTDGVGMVFDGRFRSFAVDFTVEQALAPAGLYRINPQTLSVTPVPLTGTDLDAAVKTALDSAVQGDVIVLQVRADAKITSKNVTSGPYSRVVAYDGHGTDNFWEGGSTNAGLQLPTSDDDLDPAGSLSGYLRVVVDSTHAQTAYRFVRDNTQVAYSTNVARTATTNPDGGAVYRLVSTTSGQALTSPGGSARMSAAGTDLGQQWQLVPVYGGFFNLVNQANDQCLAASTLAVSTTDCGPADRDLPAQLWFPQYDSSKNAYRLLSAYRPPSYPGRDQPDTTGYLTAHGEYVRTSPNDKDQYWTLDVPPGVYTLQVASATNKQVGSVLAEPDYAQNGNVQLRTATLTGELNQQWQVIDGPRSPGKPQQFSLANMASGLCADVPYAQQNDGGPVNRYTCNGDNSNPINQQWTPVAKPWGLELHNVATNEALTADAGKITQTMVDDQDNPKEVWSLQRAVAPGLNEVTTLSLGDRSGRSLLVTGTAIIAAKTVAPQHFSTWTLADAGHGQVQIRNIDGHTCVDPNGKAADGRRDVAPGRCDDAMTFTATPAPDGTWTFSTPDGALVAGADGSLSMQNGATATPFLPTGLDGTMSVGRQSYRTSAAVGQAGFWVLAFDQTQKPLAGYPQTFVTGGVGGSSARGLADALTALGKTDRTTVLVQSFGRPKPTDTSWNDFATALSGLGIDGTSVLQLNGQGNFAAAGCFGCNGAPSDNEVTNRRADQPRGGARLTGQLGWTPASTRRPINGTTVPIDPGLSALVNRDRGPWPFDPGYSGADQTTMAAVNGIYEALGTWPDACHNPGADALRNTYCGQDSATWSRRVDQLDNVTYRQAQGDDPGAFDETVFDKVQQTLRREFNEVAQVHAMFDTITTLLEENFTDDNAAFSPNGVAEAIKKTIYQPDGPTPVSGNNPDNTGGVLSVIADAMIVMKDVVEVGGLILAADHKSTATAEGRVGSELGGSSYSLLADGLLLAADSVDLAGGSDDGSRSLGVDVSAPLSQYQGDLDAQLVNAVDNIDTVRDMVLSDPDQLMAASTNSSDGAWQLSSDQKQTIKTAFSAGIVSDLWPRELGAAYQLLRWPKLPDGYAVTDISAPNYTTAGFHKLYQGQPDNASVLPVVHVDASGAASSRATYVITRVVPGPLNVDKDRIAHKSIMDSFYEQTGLTTYDLPTLTELRDPPCAGADDWPFTPESGSNFMGLQKGGGKFTYFGQHAKDWTSDECKS